ncbi:hypothetical protein [Pseudaestuariivita sp.]|uniref:hypothetical protein n=1 Tax=Pseudaestuariivita sp. TaxID=2211669 RepID=UPI0040587F9A
MTFATGFPADWAYAAGILAALIGLAAYVPYFRDTLFGSTRPHRATWLIWALLSSISTASQAYEGATHSLWFSMGQSGATIVVFLMSIRGGMGSYLGRSDAPTLVAAALGIVLWVTTDSAVYALAIAIAVSALGGVATAVKAYRAPETETLSCWVLNFVAATLAVLVVGQPDPVLLAYPVYLFALYACIILAITAGRMRQRAQAPMPGRSLQQ